MNNIMKMLMMKKLIELQDKKHEPDYHEKTTEEEKEKDKLRENVMLFLLSKDE